MRRRRSCTGGPVPRGSDVGRALPASRGQGPRYSVNIYIFEMIHDEGGSAFLGSASEGPGGGTRGPSSRPPNPHPLPSSLFRGAGTRSEEHTSELPSR